MLRQMTEFSDYSEAESWLMFFFGLIANLACVPALLLIYRFRASYTLFVGSFGLLCTFMYHSSESLFPNDSFIDSQAEWHRLDNVAVVSCLNALIVHLMNNNSRQLDLFLNLFLFTLTMFCQEFSSWSLEYSLFPIAVAAAIYILLKLFRKDPETTPHINKKMLIRGLVLLAISAILFFVA